MSDILWDRWHDMTQFKRLPHPHYCVICTQPTNLYAIHLHVPLHIGLCYKKRSLELFKQLRRGRQEFEWWSNLGR